jgi:hypothetical protein
MLSFSFTSFLLLVTVMMMMMMGAADGLCTSSETNIFHVKVDLFASELGTSESGTDKSQGFSVCCVTGSHHRFCETRSDLSKLLCSFDLSFFFSCSEIRILHL